MTLEIPVVEPVSVGGVYSLLWLVIALPLASAAIILVGGPLLRGRLDRWAPILGCATVLASFVVGLASYLLIGFWQHKPTAAAAAVKAFVMNRVGDLGMALAIMLMFTTFGTFSFSGVSALAEGASEKTLTILGLLLLLAACGKS